MVIHPQNSFAENICFEESVAKKIFTDLSVCKEVDKELEKLKIEFESERSAFDVATGNLEKQIALLDDQRQDEHDRGEKYRLEWKECGKVLTKCQQTKPNRTTWFGAGFGSALIIAVIVLAL